MGFRIQSLRGGWCRPEDCKQAPHRQSRTPKVGSLRFRFWVEGLEFGVFGLGGQGFGFRVWGLRFREMCSVFAFCVEVPLPASIGAASLVRYILRSLRVQHRGEPR